MENVINLAVSFLAFVLLSCLLIVFDIVFSELSVTKVGKFSFSKFSLFSSSFVVSLERLGKKSRTFFVSSFFHLETQLC